MAIEKHIQVGVAWADLIVSKFISVIPTIFIILVFLIILWACIYVNVHNDRF